ncbi:hypothetical protein GCM10023310_10400 [Paenibacillus vulneris]|uniref:TIM-barrel domain-containing protein n=1 Tax=Paenibacillus vulneris TaxID=1133364 RepID=A0ABW3UEN4_9BACL
MNSSVTLRVESGGFVRVEVIGEWTFRIQLSRDAQFKDAALLKYGIVRGSWPKVRFELQETGDGWQIQTSGAQLSVSKYDGRIVLKDAKGQILLREAVPGQANGPAGLRAEFELSDEERLYGLGDESREGIQKRGHRAKMWVKNVDCYAPIPYVMSSRGWAFFFNTTWRHFFDLGYTNKERWSVFAKRGELDYYLIAGESLPRLINRFTDITGKPHVLPIWAYGLTFVCNEQADAKQMLDDALNFRREGIPCDLIGLEPGWMARHYDYSTKKTWHPERFYIPPWAPTGPQNFTGALERLGFKLSLWLCSDYDVTHHEEREREGSEQELNQGEPLYHPEDFEQDLRAHTPIYMDQITNKEEPWFQHLKKFVDQGVSAFKMDGARQVNEHPDRKWANGMDDEEMHNLYPTILNKQMHQGYSEHTGRRSMIYSSGGYTGIQQFAATWAGDTGGGPKPLISLLNHGLSGHSNTSCDMDVFTPEGIHFGFLQPWSQVNSWAYWRQPWLLGERLLPIFKDYARLRYSLIPYIYSAAHNAALTGMPILRAMPLVLNEEPQIDHLVNQYMLGEHLLVGAFTNHMYLPKGKWWDFWSGRTWEGGREVVVGFPVNRGGPLLVKGGAIIPTWSERDYIGQKSAQEIHLQVYTGGSSSFVLYEDDGVSYQYKEGKIAVTEFLSQTRGNEFVLTIGVRRGSYDGMPAHRSYKVSILAEACPLSVTIDGNHAGEEAWTYDKQAKCIQIQDLPDSLEDASREIIIRF